MRDDQPQRSLDLARCDSGEVVGVIAGGNSEDLGDVRLSIEPYVPDALTGGVSREAKFRASLEKIKSGKLDEMELLEKIPTHARMRVEFQYVSAFVPQVMLSSGAIAQMKNMGVTLSRQFSKLQGAQVPSTKKQILYGLSGSVQPGELLALMGPSGSGKTSLLSILGARAPKLMETKGDILFNGMELTKAQKRKMGFVMQDDLMYESLTVYETLFYAASLRLPRKMSRAEKRERVEAVIVALGLSKCRNTLVGGFTMRGVSGGERKRVSVGHELLINPAVILLDEPTSGLDSTTAMHLIMVLRKLAAGGRAILTTIHQPSSRLYQQLDSLMLLSEGRMMYYGTARLVVDWFASLSYPCPYGVNVADFILDLANGDVEVEDKSGEQARQEMVTSYCGFHDKHPQGLLSRSDLEETNEEGRSESNTASNHSDRFMSSEETPGAFDGLEDSGSRDTHRWGVGFWEQLQLLTARTVRTRRFEALSIQKFIQILGVALITALLWWRRGGENHLLSASDVAGLLFFELLFIGFTAMFAALFTFPNESRMMVKERASGMYRLSAFYLARTLSDLPMDCFIPSLYVFILYWGGGLRATFTAFVGNWLAVLLELLVSQSFGLLLGAAISNPKNGQTALTLIMLTMMLAGGFYVRDIPVWISWVKYFSFISWTYNILLKLEFQGRDFEDCGKLNSDDRVEGAPEECVPVESVEDALSLPIDVNGSVLVDVLVLFAMLIVLRTTVYYVLKKKTRM